MTLLEYHLHEEIGGKNFRSVTDKDENVNDSFSKDTQDQELPVLQHWSHRTLCCAPWNRQVYFKTNHGSKYRISEEKQGH